MKKENKMSQFRERHFKKNRLSRCFVKNVVTLLAATSVFVAFNITSENFAFADQSLGVGAIPYIVIVTDTSASTEQTNEGKNQFPFKTNDKNARFQTSDPMNVVDSLGNLTVGSYKDSSNYYGPCAIWEPPSCANYERPSYNLGGGPTKYGPVISSTNPTWREMDERIKYQLSERRLTEQNQPRHVTIKEILTGDMLLGTTDEEADENLFGPTCWIVPRQYRASVYPEMQKYCPTGNFRNYSDVRTPIPHFQEVFDIQKRNGLLDTLGRTAIFAYSGLDSFSGVEFNDLYTTYPASYYPSGRTQLREDTTCPGGKPCINLGINRIIGPKSLDSLSFAELSRANEYTQLAIIDAGYLRKPGSTAEKVIIGGSSGDPRFQNTDSRFLADLELGLQPITRSTPLAAAAYDIGNFFALSETDPNNPLHINNDPYTECRDRQVVFISDGEPGPERSSPNINSNVGSVQLSAAYGYDINIYPYDTAEKEISFLHQYKPKRGKKVKVHVVSLIPPLSAKPTKKEIEERKDRLRKADAMAGAGGTCASATLSSQWISKTSNPNECPRNGGPGVDNGIACLDISDRGDYGGPKPVYTYEDPKTGAISNCDYPALVLTKNSRSDIEAALAETLNNIIQESNVLSKTRTVYSSFLGQVTDCNMVKTMARGENEFLSGTMIGGGISWKGLLYRNTYACGCNPANACTTGGNAPTDTDFSDQISKQVKKEGGDYKDNRRIFTVFPDQDSFDYVNASWTGAFNSVGYKQISTTNPDYFFYAYKPFIPSSSFSWSTFKSPRLTPTSYPGQQGKVQIEFEYESFKDTGLFPQYLVIGGTYTETVPAFLGLEQPRMQANEERVKRFFNRMRGRDKTRENRVLGGIYNGNPAVLDPPNLDLPIDSYKIFKTKNRQRPAVLFVPTNDGFLHAIYGGEGQRLNTSGNEIGVIKHRNYRTGSDPLSTGSTSQVFTRNSSQREAWAYVPFMLLRKLSLNWLSNPYLMDATPTVKDVRLCQASREFNQNETVCGKVDVDPVDQWRSVLVQGLGMAGVGYFALDVTYQGGPTDLTDISRTALPDPIPLWEFSPQIEKRQIEFLHRKGKLSRYGTRDTGLNKCFGKSNRFWEQTYMGYSVSDPEIGTVLIDKPNGSGRIQRAIAFFGGGEPDPHAQVACNNSESNRSGKVVYVIDLQTGSMIRRFVSYFDKNGKETLFPAGMVGSPALYNSFPGAVATRGFIGDSEGRLFKIDMTSSNPEDWKAYLFFDPTSDEALKWFAPSLVGTKPQMGEAAYKPAITKMSDNNLLVVYGLGERGDTVSLSKVRAVFGLRDRVTSTNSELPIVYDPDPAKNNAIWFNLLNVDQKLTGSPVIFNNSTYYPTYKVDDPKNLCLPGRPEITRVDKQGVPEITSFDDTTQKTIVRGLSVRINPCCAGNQTPPELVASTGGTDLVQKAGGGGGHGGGSSAPGTPPKTVGQAKRTGDLSTFRSTIATPTSQSIPLSWARLIN